MSMSLSEKDVARFWSKVKKTETCWLWEGTIKSDGYGQFKMNGHMVSAHRLAFKLIHGYEPEEIHHMCEVRCCMNAEHMIPVTRRQNNQLKEHDTCRSCGRSDWYVFSNGKRKCRPCTIERRHQ